MAALIMSGTMLAPEEALAGDPCAAIMCMSEQIGKAPSDCKSEIGAYFSIRVYRKKRKFDPAATSVKRMQYLEECKHFDGGKKFPVNAKYGMIEYDPFRYTGDEALGDFKKQVGKLGSPGEGVQFNGIGNVSKNGKTILDVNKIPGGGQMGPMGGGHSSQNSGSKGFEEQTKKMESMFGKSGNDNKAVGNILASPQEKAKEAQKKTTETREQVQSQVSQRSSQIGGGFDDMTSKLKGSSSNSKYGSDFDQMQKDMEKKIGLPQ